jgi:hypothetical protein
VDPKVPSQLTVGAEPKITLGADKIFEFQVN